MKHVTILLAATLLLRGQPGLAAPTKPKLAVMPLVGDAVTALLTDILTVRTGELGRFDVVSTDEIDAMLGMERLKDTLGCDNVACAAEIGGALGAELMLTGNVGRLGDQLIIKLSFFDAGNMTVRKRVLRQIPDDEAQYAAGITEALHAVLAEGVEDAWKTVEPLAKDGSQHHQIRDNALVGFLDCYPEQNPHADEARKLRRLLSHGRLMVETEPVGAQITVDGEVACTSPCQVLIRPGKHRVAARMESFIQRDLPVALERERTTRVSLVLEEDAAHKYARWRNISFITGLAGGVMAGVGHAVASSTVSDARAGDVEAHRTNHAFSSVAISGWVIAGIGTAMGLILWGNTPEPAAPHVAAPSSAEVLSW